MMMGHPEKKPQHRGGSTRKEPGKSDRSATGVAVKPGSFRCQVGPSLYSGEKAFGRKKKKKREVRTRRIRKRR